MLDSCAGQFRFTSRARHLGAVQRLVGAAKTVSRRRAVALQTIGLDANVLALDEQLGHGFEHAVALRGGALEGMTQCGRAVDGREDAAACSLDIRLESFDLTVSNLIGRRLCAQRLRRALALRKRRFGRCPALVEFDPRWLSARFQHVELLLDDPHARTQLICLPAVEGDLLLQPVDVQLARVGHFTSRRCTRLGFRQFDSRTSEIGFDFGDVRRGCGLSLARIRKACAG